MRLKDGEVIVPESAALMQYRPADPQKKGEQLAETLRRSKRRELQSRTRAQCGNAALRGRSEPPLITGL